MSINIADIFLKSFFQTFLTFKPLLPFLVVVISIKLFVVLYKRYRYEKAGIFTIDKMTGDEFEEYLMVLFGKLGYQVTHVGSHTGDYGADLVIEKEGIKTAVQAKRNKLYIGNDAVQQVFSAIPVYKCNNALVVTNAYFSKPARSQAEADKVVLWDREKLISIILSLKK